MPSLRTTPPQRDRTRTRPPQYAQFGPFEEGAESEGESEEGGSSAFALHEGDPTSTTARKRAIPAGNRGTHFLQVGHSRRDASLSLQPIHLVMVVCDGRIMAVGNEHGMKTITKGQLKCMEACDRRLFPSRAHRSRSQEAKGQHTVGCFPVCWLLAPFVTRPESSEMRQQQVISIRNAIMAMPCSCYIDTICVHSLRSVIE